MQTFLRKPARPPMTAMRRPAVQRREAAQDTLLGRRASGCVPGSVYDTLRSGGQALDASTRARMESRFGHDFSQVRVHADAQAAESARAVNALAYTVGRDVVFGAGRYAPASAQGQKLLAHELTHVLQQGALAFQPGNTLSVGAPDDTFEEQAETAATASHGDPTVAGSMQAALSVQRAINEMGIEEGNSGAKDTENLCAGWLNDPESITKRAAEHYVRSELAGDRGHVERIECDLSAPSGAFGCIAHFSDGTPIRVIVRKDAIIVSVYPIQSMYPPPDRPLCWYDYACPGPNRDIVLTKRKCQSAQAGGGTQSGNGSSRKGPNP